MIVTSTIISIIIQLLTGGIDVWGLTIPVQNNFNIYRDLLKIELGVQTVELIFYIWLVTKLHALKNITIYRYIDWFVTTPTMLFTLIVYLYHRGQELSLTDFISTNKRNIIIITGLNALMLVFGLLGELGILSVNVSVTLGFIPFAYYFWFIYKEYIMPLPDADSHAKTININDNATRTTKILSKNTKRYVFLYFLVFWSLYGICAYLPYVQKNTGYTILDLFAKNGFGILLVYFIWQLRSQ
jgi:bacteriorhodopsin